MKLNREPRALLFAGALAWAALFGPGLEDDTPPGEPQSSSSSTREQLEDLQRRIDAVIFKCSPATVRIQLPEASGSGVLISADGLVLCAAHVTGKPGRTATVRLGDGREFLAETLGANEFRDSGMLRIKDAQDLPYVELAGPAVLPSGSWLLALGYPRGGVKGRPPVPRLGRSSRGRGRFLRTDCALISGDSGGPLFDLDGRLVGIHSRVEEDVASNYHVPMSSFRLGYERLLAGERWSQTTAMLGIQGIAHDARGVICGPIVEGGPAARAGLRAGDVIAELNGEQVDFNWRLRHYLSDLTPGESVELDILRGDGAWSVEVILGDNRLDGIGRGRGR